jgi:ATP-binding protein involved in chromosome partitioning
MSQNQPPQNAPADPPAPLPGVDRIIAVGAGKGGVGKSTVAVNLAIGLARAGAKVGILDGDIYGPSLTTMLGINGKAPRSNCNALTPFQAHGIEAMTLGALVEADKPLIWRGPMAHGAFQQIAMQTQWGNLDYLIIDLPPGTGDVPLTMSQLLPLTGAVIVCTPQKVAQDDARRAVGMFQKLGIEVLGVVENMSYFIGDDGKEYDIFGKGGAEAMAAQLGLPSLGAIPINMALRKNCDAGDPTANFTAGDKLTESLDAFVNSFKQRVEEHIASGGAEQPTISVS